MPVNTLPRRQCQVLQFLQITGPQGLALEGFFEARFLCGQVAPGFGKLFVEGAGVLRGLQGNFQSRDVGDRRQGLLLPGEGVKLGIELTAALLCRFPSGLQAFVGLPQFLNLSDQRGRHLGYAGGVLPSGGERGRQTGVRLLVE